MNRKCGPAVRPVLCAGRVPRTQLIFQTGSAQRCCNSITLTACSILFR